MNECCVVSQFHTTCYCYCIQYIGLLCINCFSTLFLQFVHWIISIHKCFHYILETYLRPTWESFSVWKWWKPCALFVPEDGFYFQSGSFCRSLWMSPSLNHMKLISRCECNTIWFWNLLDDLTNVFKTKLQNQGEKKKRKILKFQWISSLSLG